MSRRVKKDKVISFETILLTADKPTMNGNVYPERVLQQAITRAAPKIRDRRLWVGLPNLTGSAPRIADMVGYIDHGEMNSGEMILKGRVFDATVAEAIAAGPGMFSMASRGSGKTKTVKVRLPWWKRAWNWVKWTATLRLYPLPVSEYEYEEVEEFRLESVNLLPRRPGTDRPSNIRVTEVEEIETELVAPGTDVAS